MELGLKQDNNDVHVGEYGLYIKIRLTALEKYKKRKCRSTVDILRLSFLHLIFVHFIDFVHFYASPF